MQTTQTPFHQKTHTRLTSLDVFRGITIALMILVNSPGNNTVYPWFEHSAWNGCTLADLVFPFFIFIVGVSSVFSLSKCNAKGLTTTQQLPKIAKRTLIIFVIGLLLNAFPYHFDFATIRVLGVLQRIALCYFAAAFLFLTTTPRTQLVLMISLLIGYWLMMVFFSPQPFAQDNNFSSYIDRLCFSAYHLYLKTSDPEGVLSTLPAIATALMGNLTATWLLSRGSKQHHCHGLIITGFFALATGWVWGIWFPINKSIWSSSYVLWTGGWALLVLAGCYWLIEIKHWKKWSKGFEIFGVNALVAYILHVFFLKVQFMISIAPGENLKAYLTDSLFGWAAPMNASLFYAISYTLLWFGILSILYHKKIYIRL